jgi:hypothetical protein
VIRRDFCTLLSFGVALLLPATVTAGIVTFNPINASWINGIPVQNVKTYNANTPNPLARWGGNSTSSTPSPADSGYDFQAVAVPLNVAVPPNANSGVFDLGTFTHHNNPIPSGTSITMIELSLTTGVYIDTVFQQNMTFVFDFHHDETPNNDNPCADGNPNGTGVNINGCADHVTTSWSTSSDTFNLAGDIYTLNIFGFKTASGQAVDFWTIEGQDNLATLQAKVQLTSTLPEITVPEPTTLALLGLGLAGLGFSRRKQ